VNRFFRSAFFPLVVIAAVAWLAVKVLDTRASPQKKTYAQLILKAQNDPSAFSTSTPVVFQPTKQEIDATVDGQSVVVNYPTDQAQIEFQNLLEKQGINFDSSGVGGFSWTSALFSFLPFVLLIAFWIFLMNQVQGGGSKVMSFGKSRAKRMTPDSPKIGFKDVAGVDEAV